MYLQIVVNIPRISGVFDYLAPEPFAQTINPGCLVEVPFGRQLFRGLYCVKYFPQVPKPGRSIPVGPATGGDGTADRTCRKRLPCKLFIAGVAGDDDPAWAASAGRYSIPLEPQGEEALPEAIEKLSPDSVNDITSAQIQTQSARAARPPLEAAFRHEGWRKAMRFFRAQRWVTSFAVLPPPVRAQKQCAPYSFPARRKRSEQIADLGAGMPVSARGQSAFPAEGTLAGGGSLGVCGQWWQLERSAQTGRPGIGHIER